MRAVVGFLLLGIPSVGASAQTSPSGLPVTGSPAAVAFAGGGAAAARDPVRAVELGALAPLDGTTFFATLSSGADGVDLRSYAAGMSLALSPTLFAGVLSRWRQVSNLIDDPSIPEDGLTVSDWEVRAGLAKGIAGRSLILAGTATLVRSTVFATRATTLSTGGSILVSPFHHVRVLAVIDALGQSTQYVDATGRRLRSAQPTRWLGALAFTAIRLGLVRQGLYLDYERVTHARPSHLVAVATDASVADIAVLRAGIAWRRTDESFATWRRTLGLGFQLHVSRVALDYGYAVGLPADDLAPRHHFGVSWTQAKRSPRSGSL